MAFIAAGSERERVSIGRRCRFPGRATVGRPSKYTDELADRIAGGIRDGLTNKDAALAAGISEHTFLLWEKRNPRFGHLIAQARAERAAYAWSKAKQHGAADWRFWLEFIDRTCPDYRKRAVVEADVTLLVRKSAERLGLDADETRALHDQIRALLAAARADDAAGTSRP